MAKEETNIPTTIYNKLLLLETRLRHIDEEYIPKDDKKGHSFVEQTMKILKDLFTKLEQEYAEPKPRTFQDAIKWIKRKGVGSYLVMLDDEKNILRTIRVSKEIIGELPCRIAESKISIEMTKKVLQIPEINLERSIPKSATQFKWVFSPTKGEIQK